jgi:hypothetical protein
LIFFFLENKKKMSSSCAVEINGLLLAIESGQTPYPIFFHNFGCGDASDSNNGDQTHRPVSTAYRWPQAGVILKGLCKIRKLLNDFCPCTFCYTL